MPVVIVRRRCDLLWSPRRRRDGDVRPRVDIKTGRVDAEAPARPNEKLKRSPPRRATAPRALRFDRWYPKLRRGGIVAGHDFCVGANKAREEGVDVWPRPDIAPELAKSR